MAYVSQESVCKTLITDANKAAKRGDFLQSEQFLKEAVDRLECATGNTHPRLASVLIRLGDFYLGRSRFQEAESQFRRAMTIYESAFGDENLDVALCLQHLAEVLCAQDRPEEARYLKERSTKILSQRLNNLGFQINHSAS